MPYDIADTCTHVRNTGHSYIVEIARLAGKEDNTRIRLVAEQPCSLAYLDLLPIDYGPHWQLHCYAPEKEIEKGSVLEIHLRNQMVFSKCFLTAPAKIGTGWLSIVSLSHFEFVQLATVGLKQLVVANDAPKLKVCFVFSPQPQEHYESVKQGEELLKIIFSKVLDESMRQESIHRTIAASVASLPNAASVPVTTATASDASVADGLALNRQYNLNTPYGRRMARNQAAYNYANGSQEYRADVDRMKFWAGLILVGLLLLIFIVIALLKGSGAAIKAL